jgi:hypothetical protein
MGTDMGTELAHCSSEEVADPILAGYEKALQKFNGPNIIGIIWRES